MKKWYTSKTVWANVLALVIGIVYVVVNGGAEIGVAPQVIALLTGIVIPIINVVLRFLTNKGVEL